VAIARNPIVEADLERIVSAPLPWDGLRDKTVLVTGAAGFLPAYLVETLLFLNEADSSMNVRVLALVRSEKRARERFAHHTGRSDLGLVVQDVCDPVCVDERVDMVIHAASHASPRFYGTKPVETLMPNVMGTYQLLEFCRRSGAERLMYFSSGEVYGEIDDACVPTPEGVYGLVDPVNPRSCYAESKRMGETMCVAWHREYGLSTRIVRPFHTYGPGMRLRNDGRVFADFVADVVAGRDIVMRSDGTARRAFCYISDATIGFFTVLLKGEDALPYNVGNEDGETSIIDLAEMLVGILPEKKLRVVRMPPPDDGSYMQSAIARNAPDTSRLRALGWSPNITVVDGFSRTIRSYE
jgi:UDP-glucuronate decarboxylase